MNQRWNRSIAFMLMTFALERPLFANHSITLYGGPATSAVLLDVIKLRIPDLMPFGIVVGNYEREVVTLSEIFAIDALGGVSYMFDTLPTWEIHAGGALRLHSVPWERVLPGTMALGVGVSYASNIPNSEATLATSARFLFHLLIDFEFYLTRDRKWSLLFRDHHRSGVFGLFGNVVGGSDYLCLGIRTKL